jgi:hypothetical protein
MGWRPWELERLEHPRDFLEAIKGFLWRQQQEMDRAAFIAIHVLNAAGGAKTQDTGERITIEHILGRPLCEPLIPPIEVDEAKREIDEMERTERQARAERAKLMIYAAQKAREARLRGEDPGAWSGG